MTNPFKRRHRRPSQGTVIAGLRKDIQTLQLKAKALQVRIEQLEQSDIRHDRLKEGAQRYRLRQLNPAMV